ncbi:hypothetical protein JB92DRAFT_3103742 [Gautieria morchelliformis]|nr:hypothetical protein JB92DRAFT_3103742 [Gautieria morchelliformis]
MSSVDEIAEFWDARYLSAGEAAWRILGFHITSKDPSVTALPVHTPKSTLFHQYERTHQSTSTLSKLDRYFCRPRGSFEDNDYHMKYVDRLGNDVIAKFTEELSQFCDEAIAIWMSLLDRRRLMSSFAAADKDTTSVLFEEAAATCETDMQQRVAAIPQQIILEHLLANQLGSRPQKPTAFRCEQWLDINALHRYYRDASKHNGLLNQKLHNKLYKNLWNYQQKCWINATDGLRSDKLVKYPWPSCTSRACDVQVSGTAQPNSIQEPNIGGGVSQFQEETVPPSQMKDIPHEKLPATVEEMEKSWADACKWHAMKKKQAIKTLKEIKANKLSAIQKGGGSSGDHKGNGGSKGGGGHRAQGSGDVHGSSLLKTLGSGNAASSGTSFTLLSHALHLKIFDGDLYDSSGYDVFHPFPANSNVMDAALRMKDKAAIRRIHVYTSHSSNVPPATAPYDVMISDELMVRGLQQGWGIKDWKMYGNLETLESFLELPLVILHHKGEGDDDDEGEGDDE